MVDAGASRALHIRHGSADGVLLHLFSILPDQSHHDLGAINTKVSPSRVSHLHALRPFLMASQDLGTLDRWNSSKYQAWLKTLSDERLRQEARTVQSKHTKATWAMIGNIIAACFTVPATVGIAAFFHAAAHAAAQANYANYGSQIRSCKAQLGRRWLTI